MFIGNVITSDKIKLDPKFNIVETIEEAIENIPTLIIGLNNIKKLNIDFLYTNRKIDNNTFWTFTRIENRVFFEEDLFYFIEHCYSRLINEINFEFIDLILSDTIFIRNVFDTIEKNDNVISYTDNHMVYVFFNKNIYAFDLRQVIYIGKDSDRFIDKIKSLSNVFLDNPKILIEYKNELSMFNDEVKYVPLIYSIRNNE